LSVPSSVEFWEFPIGEALVLARPDVQGLFLLNSTSRLIWSALRLGVTVESLARQFTAEFDIPHSQAVRDIAATIDSWREDLLSTAPPTQSSVPYLPSTFSPCFVGNYRLGAKQFRLEVNDQDFADEIAPRLAHLHSDTASPGIHFQVLRVGGQLKLLTDGVLFGEELEANAARAVLLQEISRVAQPGAEWLAILHAGACGAGTDCVIMPAETNVGKTTLTAALMHSGLRFLSDDSAAIDRRTLQVAVMPFALMLREGSWPVLASRFPELAAVPILERSGYNVRFLAPPTNNQLPAVPKCLLFIEFRPDAVTTLNPLTPFESLLRLQKTGFWVAHDRVSIASFLSWIQSIPSYRATYSDLSEATALVRGLLNGSSN